jgi:Na+/H+ antiporter NhaD/arsenite permease-like protein
MIPIIVVALVFILIIIRRIGKFRLQIWQIMLAGAVVVLATIQISPQNALKAINLDVMFFLFGMFIVGEALVESGYLSYLSYRLFRRAKSLDSLVLIILFGMGLTAAFLMNDTLAIIGTPVVILLARKADTSPKILLLALAFAVTIGTVTSPIGNPQNLLIAVNGNVPNPFITFFRYLFFPTLVNLLLAYFLLRVFYRKQFVRKTFADNPELIKDPKLAQLSRISLVLLVVLILIKIFIVFAGLKIDFRLTYIALAAALPIILFSPKRFTVIRKIDWSTLVFFAAMFVLMASVWNSGVFQNVINSTTMNLTSIPVIMGIGVILSQFISNVPLVALYLPMLMKIGVTNSGLMALAAGSTIAGNLTILGAASNVIIIQNAEQKSGETLTFWEFVRIGVPLTAINVFVYWLFLTIIR